MCVDEALAEEGTVCMSGRLSGDWSIPDAVGEIHIVITISSCCAIRESPWLNPPAAG